MNGNKNNSLICLIHIFLHFSKEKRKNRTWLNAWKINYADKLSIVYKKKKERIFLWQNTSCISPCFLLSSSWADQYKYLTSHVGFNILIMLKPPLTSTLEKPANQAGWAKGLLDNGGYSKAKLVFLFPSFFLVKSCWSLAYFAWAFVLVPYIIEM